MDHANSPDSASCKISTNGTVTVAFCWSVAGLFFILGLTSDSSYDGIKDGYDLSSKPESPRNRSPQIPRNSGLSRIALSQEGLERGKEGIRRPREKQQHRIEQNC